VLSKNAKLKTAYMGMAVTLHSDRGSFGCLLPAAAIAEVRKMLDGAKGAAEKE